MANGTSGPALIWRDNSPQHFDIENGARMGAVWFAGELCTTVAEAGGTPMHPMLFVAGTLMSACRAYPRTRDLFTLPDFHMCRRVSPPR